jgi:hypothetical protein
MRVILHFDPVLALSGVVGAIEALRDDPLKTHIAGDAK